MQFQQKLENCTYTRTYIYSVCKVTAQLDWSNFEIIHIQLPPLKHSVAASVPVKYFLEFELNRNYFRMAGKVSMVEKLHRSHSLCNGK